MDKHYDSKKAESKWYKLWEESGYFRPEINPDGDPYTIILPPPNASGKMHTGNVLMIAIEDLLIRWKRMQGYASLWVPGTDHAGTETQITFERELGKLDKSRFDYSRQELYDEIWKFVQNNKHNIESQIRQMGASVDWSRYKFTLDDDAIETVHNTFKKMYRDELVYKSDYMVNYCPKCGTSYADVEIAHKEKTDPLYYIRYKFTDSDEFITVATTRPEPIWFDTHLAINPKDKKNLHLVKKGKIVFNPLSGKEMSFITDDFVDPEFGTGIVKLTPGIDKNDYEVARRHPEVPIIEILEWDGSGKMSSASPYAGMSVNSAREKAVEDLKAKGAIEKIDEKYEHSVSLCKAGHQIEPLIIPNWFVKVDDPNKSFKKPALEVVKNGTVKIYPKWREITYVRWMEEMRDWPISRQNVWGIRIPVWYEINETSSSDIYVWFLDKKNQFTHGILADILGKGHTLEEISKGLQRLLAQKEVSAVFDEDKKEGKDYLPETDTFDTWFSSGQWPLVTLGYPDSPDFKKYYPTAVLETGWEIIRLWVSRMIMFGLYNAGQVPFYDVYLHGHINALDGRKMSKSLGNVINPDDYIEEFGVDALRMGMISGTANGKNFNFPRDKIIAFKHFNHSLARGRS